MMKFRSEKTNLARLGFSVCCAVLLLFLPITQVYAASQPIKTEKRDRVLQTLRTSGYIRVIIHVAHDVDPASEAKGLLKKDTRGSAIRAIRAAVDPVVNDYFPGRRNFRPTAVRTFDTLPAIAADINERLLARLEADPRIKRIEIDDVSRTNLSASLPLIGMSTSQTALPDGNGRLVAVIDTGTDRTHPFITSARIAAEACFLSTLACPNGTDTQTEIGSTGVSRPSAGESHGTHVAGIALGNQTLAALPARGVANKAGLVSINVFGAQGGAYSSDIIAGLEYVEALVVNNSFKIDSVNMSLGSSSTTTTNCDSDSRKPVIDRLRALGTLTVIAAGNGYSTNGMSAPGCISTSVSVAASSKNTATIAYYSNINANTDVMAPGGSSDGCVTSSIIGGGYADYCGTSMAAPHVAGAVAALRSIDPTLSADTVESILKSTGSPVSDTRSGGQFSAPLINIANADAFIRNLTFYDLTLTKSGDGIVTSNPAGVACSGVCTTATGSFVEGTSITLTASDAATTKFSNWTGACSSTTPTCTVSLTSDTTVGAVFASAIVPLSDALDLNGISSGSLVTNVSGNTSSWFGQTKTSSDSVDAGRSGAIGDNQQSAYEATVTGPGTLTFKWAVSSEGNYDFLRFSINGVQQAAISGSVGFTTQTYTLASGTQTLRWTYSKDVNVVSGSDAGFVDAVQFTAGAATFALNLSKRNSSFGSVTSSPAGISCGTSCSSQSASFTSGTSVTLTATPVSRRRVSGWSGCQTVSGNTCTVSMSTIRNVTVSFK